MIAADKTYAPDLLAAGIHLALARRQPEAHRAVRAAATDDRRRSGHAREREFYFPESVS
ncbi:MAG: hypothetical protein U1E76_18140 [Planctomycetota bacterium]